MISILIELAALKSQDKIGHKVLGKWLSHGKEESGFFLKSEANMRKGSKSDKWRENLRPHAEKSFSLQISGLFSKFSY